MEHSVMKIPQTVEECLDDDAKRQRVIHPPQQLEWRAVPYVRDSKVMEYKASVTETHWLFGQDTRDEWIRPKKFIFLGDEHRYEFDYDFNWVHFIVSTREEFEEYKKKFQTYEQLQAYLKDNRDKAYAWWKPRRDALLETWE